MHLAIVLMPFSALVNLSICKSPICLLYNKYRYLAGIL